eukprot:scaffold87363_cov20-Tisochrysis_lutea.AAC.1
MAHMQVTKDVYAAQTKHQAKVRLKRPEDEVQRIEERRFSKSALRALAFDGQSFFFPLHDCLADGLKACYASMMVSDGFGSAPASACPLQVGAIHAGLECGIIGAKFP